MAFYFDTFNRADSTTSAGTSDSGHTYSTISPRVGAGISSSALYQPSASTVAIAKPNITANEFDVTITVGSIASGQYVYFVFRAEADSITGLFLKIATTGVTLLGGLTDTLATGATAVSAASTVRIRNTRKKISVWVGSTLQFTFSTAIYEDNSTFFFFFPQSTTATINAVSMSALNEFTVTNFADNVKTKRRLPTTSTAIPDTWFYDALPEALRFIQKEIPFWYATQTVTTVAGTASYPLEAGTIEVIQAYISGSEPMGVVDFDTYVHGKSLDTRGEPRRYLLLGSEPTNTGPGIGFYLIPDAAYTVNVWAKKTFQSTLSAMTDTVDVPKDWFDCIAMFLTALSYEYDEDTGMADRWLTKAGERLTQIKAIEEDKVNRSYLASMSGRRVKIAGGVEYEVG